MLAATTWRACPTSKCRLSEDGTAIPWDTSKAGEPAVDGVLSGDLTIAEAGTGYNGSAAGTLENVDLINQAFVGRGRRQCTRHR